LYSGWTELHIFGFVFRLFCDFQEFHWKPFDNQLEF
jgi:hypothetical protein